MLMKKVVYGANQVTTLTKGPLVISLVVTLIIAIENIVIIIIYECLYRIVGPKYRKSIC